MSRVTFYPIRDHWYRFGKQSCRWHDDVIVLRVSLESKPASLIKAWELCFITHIKPFSFSAKDMCSFMPDQFCIFYMAYTYISFKKVNQRKNEAGKIINGWYARMITMSSYMLCDMFLSWPILSWIINKVYKRKDENKKLMIN